jgi:hypothetical protein
MSKFSGIITSQFKQVFKDAISALLEDAALTVPCKLAFENTKLQDCPNCIYDPLTHRSSNQYQPGGPIPFIDGQICPYCVGNGSLSFSAEETVYLGIIKPVFFGVDKLELNNVNYIDGMIQSLCSIDLYPKLKNASYIIVDTNILDITNTKFVRHRDPTPVGFGDNSFIITTWKNVQ